MKTWETPIQVNLLTPEPVYDTKYSWAFLTKKHAQLKEGWIALNGLQELWSADDLSVAGLASGAWAAAYDVKTISKPVDRYGVYECPLFESIHIELFYRTLIFIPSDYPAGSCEYETIKAHEVRHHAVNTRAALAYTDRLRNDLRTMMQQLEDSNSHVPKAESGRVMEGMAQAIQDAVQIYFQDYMQAEMAKQNALIDTQAEYAAVTAALHACKQ